MKIIITLSITALVIFILLSTRPDSHARLQPLPPPTVQIDRVDKLDIQPVLAVTGKLQPAQKTHLHFQVSGQINQRLVEAGQRVQQGAALLALDDGDFQDAVVEAEAMLTNEKKAIERDGRLLELIVQERQLQEQEVARLKRLEKNALSSKSNFDQALQALYRQESEEASLKHSVNSARSRLMIEQVRLNKAQRNLERTKLSAPFSGTINQVKVDVGDFVSQEQMVIELVQLDELDLNLEVSGAIARHLNLAQRIVIETEAGEREGDIIALAFDPDPLTNTHSLRIRTASSELYAGQLAVARLPGESYQQALAVPLSAVLYEEGQAYLFQVVDDQLVKKPIQLIERYNDIHIIKGIDHGVTIVSKDVASLADGQSVVTHTATGS